MDYRRQQKVTHCCFKSNPTQRGYRKRMVEILTESVKFDTTSQRLADRVKLILKKHRLNNLEIIKINGQVICEGYTQRELRHELTLKIEKTKSSLSTVPQHQY